MAAELHFAVKPLPEETRTTMTARRLFNVHAHIHADTDVPAQVKEWASWGCVKWCALAMSARWQPPHATYLGNDGVLKWMREFPEVIIGMGAVELGEPMSDPDDISRLKDLGFRGLKFITPSYPYDDDRYLPLYERAEELGMPILFHAGYATCAGAADRARRLSGENMRVFRLDRVARSFPELRIIAAHLGLPHAEDALCMAMKHPHFYLDMCGGGGGKTHRSLIKRAMAPFPGADMSNPEENLALQYFRKMVFATDNPSVSVWYPAAEEIMDYLRIPEETRQLFYWGNAAEIFGIEG